MSVRPKTERLPPLVTHLLRTAAVGAFLGSFLALGFILTNAAGLGRLIAESATPVPALLLLFRLHHIDRRPLHGRVDHDDAARQER